MIIIIHFYICFNFVCCFKLFTNLTLICEIEKIEKDEKRFISNKSNKTNKYFQPVV
jgi:hypothetical protein